MNSVESVNVDKDNPKYMSEDGILFSKDKKTILYYPRQKNIGGSYTIPETVEKIAEHAFNNAQLKTIKMEDNNYFNRYLCICRLRSCRYNGSKKC